MFKRDGDDPGSRGSSSAVVMGPVAAAASEALGAELGDLQYDPHLHRFVVF